jgi:hypothetical protein
MNEHRPIAQDVMERDPGRWATLIHGPNVD